MYRLTFILLLISQVVLADRFYFDSQGGNDGNTGTSEGQAWQTLFNLSSVSSLDTVYFKRGSVWYNTNHTFNSVTAIKFFTYGTGANPQVRGTVELSGWTEVETNIWRCIDTDLPTRTGSVRMLSYVTRADTVLYPSMYPDEDSGVYEATGGSTTTLVDNTKSWTSNQWVDGFVAVAADEWERRYGEITSNTGTQLNFASIGRSVQAGSNYRIVNAYDAMTTEGEWYYDTDTLWIYSSTEPTDIEAAAQNNIFTLTNCSNFVFENIDFIGANLRCIDISGGGTNSFKGCVIAGGGENGIYASNSTSFFFTKGLVAYCGSGGIYLTSVPIANVDSNFFDHITHIDGFENRNMSLGFNGTALHTDFNSNINEFSKNIFERVRIGTQSHYTQSSGNGETRIHRNLYNGYGTRTWVADFAAHYNVNETWSSTYKLFSHNIIMDGGNPERDYDKATTVSAVYRDEQSINYHYDSNSIDGCVNPFYSNYGNRCSFNHNKIINMNRYASNTDWMSVFRVDSVLAHNNPNAAGYPLQRDTVKYNQIVLSSNTSLRYMLYNAYVSGGNPYQFDIDYNEIYDPFSRGVDDIFRRRVNYAFQSDYNLSEWNSNSGYDANSTYDNTAYSYAYMFKNFSENAVNMSLTGTYYDTDGGVITGQVNVPAFGSEILFAVFEKEDETLYIDTNLVPYYTPTFIPQPVDTCPSDSLIVIRDTVISIDSSLWSFDLGNTTPTYNTGNIIMTATKESYINNYQCESSDSAINLDAGDGDYQALLSLSSVDLGDSIVLQFCFTAFYTGSTRALFSNLSGNTGIKIQVNPSRGIDIITGTGSGLNTLTTATGIVSSGTTYEMKFVFTKGTEGNATFYLNDVFQSLSGNYYTSFDSEGVYYIGSEDGTGTDRSYGYVDEFKLLYGSVQINETYECYRPSGVKYRISGYTISHKGKRWKIIKR